MDSSSSRSFVHLHNHTEYSMLDGAAKIAPMLAEAQRLEMPAIGMTDHGNMFGASEFYNAATKAASSRSSASRPTSRRLLVSTPAESTGATRARRATTSPAAVPTHT